MTRSAFFVSDLHFGASPPAAHPHREALFCRFLDSLRDRASHLFILGDLFEFWMEYRDFIPKGHFGVLASLHALSRAGVAVHYLAGNHDFNLGGFFDRSLGLATHSRPLEIELQGRRLLLLHGDGLAASDWKQRLAKRVMVHPLSNRCFRLLHPDWGMLLARLASGASRAGHRNRPRKLAEYEAACRRLLSRGYDVVMHGHTHAAFVKSLPEGCYVCTGEWLQRLEYVEMREGVPELKLYRSPEAPTASSRPVFS